MAQKFYHKGWTVSSKGPGAGFVIFIGRLARLSKYYMCRKGIGFEEAVVMAIKVSKKKGTFNEPASIAWLKRRGLYHLIKYAVTPDLAYEKKKEPGRPVNERGWYVVTAGGGKYAGFRGDKNQKHYLPETRASKHECTRRTILAVKGDPIYGERATIDWLQKNGMGDLIETAKTTNK